MVAPEGQDPILFDCADAYVAERFVKDHSIRRLHAAVVSHLDRDHIAGMLGFLKNFLEQGGTVGALYISLDRPVEGLGAAASELLTQALQWDKEGKLPLAPSHRDIAPRPICQGTDWKVELVLPQYADVLGQRLEEGEQPNRCSAVLRVSRKDKAVLIGGDAPLVSWAKVEPALLPAAVFRTPHHGGDITEDNCDPAWTERRLYQSGAPKEAVVSVGTNNGYEHPRRAQVEAIRHQGCRLLCTQLTARCHDQPLRHRAQALSRVGAVEYPYRHRVAPGDHKRYRPAEEVPCAGSMVAWFGVDGQVWLEPPVDNWHDDLVMRLDRPMCKQPTP